MHAVMNYYVNLCTINIIICLAKEWYNARTKHNNFLFNLKLFTYAILCRTWTRFSEVNKVCLCLLLVNRV